MKRSPLSRKTPLNRGESILKRSPLRKRSKKTEEIYKERRSIVKDLLNTHNYCEACIVFHVYDRTQDGPPHTMPTAIVKQNYTRDIHELINRSQGGSILERRNLVAVCRPCHTRITRNPKEAEHLGLHLESWCNKQEHFIEAERVRNEWKNGNITKPNWL